MGGLERILLLLRVCRVMISESRGVCRSLELCSWAPGPDGSAEAGGTAGTGPWLG